MKLKVYMRVAKGTSGKPKVAAAMKPNYRPLMSGSWADRPLPTAAFALVLDIPEAIFHQAEKILAELELEDEAVQVAVEARAD